VLFYHALSLLFYHFTCKQARKVFIQMIGDDGSMKSFGGLKNQDKLVQKA